MDVPVGVGESFCLSGRFSFSEFVGIWGSIRGSRLFSPSPFQIPLRWMSYKPWLLRILRSMTLLATSARETFRRFLALMDLSKGPGDVDVQVSVGESFFLCV